VAASMTTLSQGLDGVPGALPEALDNFTSLSAVIAERRDQIGALLANVDRLTAMIRNQQADLGSLVLQGRDLLGDIVSRRAAVQRLFARATALIDTIKAILNDQPGIDGLLASMRDFSHMLAEHDALLRNTLQALPLPMRNLANATGNATALDLNPPAGP